MGNPACFPPGKCRARHLFTACSLIFCFDCGKTPEIRMKGGDTFEERNHDAVFAWYLPEEVTAVSDNPEDRSEQIGGEQTVKVWSRFTFPGRRLKTES